MQIHPTAIVSPMARMGYNVTIGPYAVIHDGVTLHDDVTIRAGAIIGSPAEKHGYFTAQGLGVEIGEATLISEHVTIHSGIIRKTTIGKNCILLTKSHVGHCVSIGDNVTVSCGALIGGESIIDDGANIALNATLHQRSHIGKWAMVGMGSVVPKKRKILPGNVYAGVPAKCIGFNQIGLERMKITNEMLNEERLKYIDATKDCIHK